MRKCLALVGALPCFLLAADDMVGARWAVESKALK